jgi:hypothetical protein
MLRKSNIILLAVFLFGLLLTGTSNAATTAALFFTPNQGEYAVDSTFDVSLMLNTGDQAINAVEIGVTFPADKLQVVSPVAGSSFVSFWIAGPSYSNSSGTITLQGGLPTPGIKTSAGVISTVKFRAKSAGKAVIRYQATSRVLANDGSGSAIPITSSQAVVTIKNSAPTGPVVFSTTHEDQSRWYPNNTFSAQWEGGGTEYSYTIDQFPNTLPDEQSEGPQTELTKSVNEDGQWYLHIRSKNVDTWGSPTHFGFKIDTSSPASFVITGDKLSFGKDERPVFSFLTTDGGSGVDHYEVRVISKDSTSSEATTYIEATSPYQLPKLVKGNYQFYVRAFDVAGNVREESLQFSVGLAGVASGKLLNSNPLVINIAIITAIFLLLILALLAFRAIGAKRRAKHVEREIAALRQEIATRRQELEQLQVVYQQATQPPTVASVERLESRQDLPA